MTDFRRINDSFAVAPQLDPADLALAAQQGFVAVVNNLPDGEQDGQPTGEEMARAAAEAGLAYAAIPVTHAGFSAHQIEGLADVMARANGPVLAYCRSGTRSANLWALTRAKAGDEADTLIEQAAGAGYDIGGLRPLLDQLSGSTRG